MPTFEAKKILLIGLGSTGNQVLQKVQEKLKWEFAPLEAMPWVRFLGVETDQASPLLGPIDSKWITLDTMEMQNVIRKPSDFQGKLALEDWMDLERVKSAGLGAITAGAGNNRMIGRLALLFERNFTMLYNEVRLRLNDLNTLDNLQAQDTLTKALTGAPWQAKFDSDDIEIVTVGTLCGGTCSGTFIDFGYLLRRIAGTNDYNGLGLKKTDSRAIFTLPPAGISNSIFASNAYAALTELDYYTDTVNLYRVKHPDIPDVVTMDGLEPYERQFLVESPGIGGDDVERLNNHIAQYLFSRIMFRPARADTDAAAVNATATHREQLSACGGPQRYFTFGMASLEYPTTQIRRACSARLAADALGAWLAPLSVSVDASWLRQIGLEESALTTALLDQKGNSIVSEISISIGNFCKRGESKPSVLNEMAAGLPNVFDNPDIKATALGDILPGAVLRTVRENQPTVFETLKQRWQTRVQQAFVSDGGNCRSALDRIVREIDAALQWLDREIQDLNKQKDAASQESVGNEILARVKSEINQVENCSRDTPLAAALWKGAAVRHHTLNVKRLALRFAEAREAYIVKTQGLLPLYLELQRFAGEIKGRIEGANPTGIQAVAVRMQKHFQEKYLLLASTKPDTPGRVLFKPKEGNQENNTVDQAYLAAISELGAQDGAFRGMRAEEIRERLYALLIKRWITEDKMDAELFRQPISDYDFISDEVKRQARMVISQSKDRLFDETASGYFNSLLNKSIVDELSANVIREELPEVNNAAELLLNLDLSNPCHVNYDNKNWRFLFHPPVGQHSDLQMALDEQIAALHIEQGRKEYNDLRRIAIVEERYAFPLGAITSLASLQNSYRAEIAAGRDPRARADVAFSGIVTNLNHKKRLLEAQQLFIVAVALGAVKFLGMGTPQPYVFVYMDAIGGEKKKKFSADCRQAAYVITDDVIHSHLRKRVEASITEMTNSYAATSLRTFIELSGAPEDKQEARAFAPAYPLQEGGAQLTRMRLYNAIETYLSDNNPPAYQEFRALMGDNKILHYVSYQVGDTFTNGEVVMIDGIYCPTCHQRLAPRDAAEKDIPTKCFKCGQNTSVRNR